MTLLTIENGELRLNSNLDEYTFGKTGHDNILSYEGVIFDGKNFKQWAFEEVKSYEAEKNGTPEHLVFYCAKNPLSKNGRTLAQYFEEGGKACLEAVKAVCAALTAAAVDGNAIPFVGAGGIMIDGESVLFAPEALFSYAANTLPAEDTLNQHQGYINDTLKGLPLLCFERAAIVYRLLSGRLPFTATDSIARNADIFDQKFLPVEYCVNGINGRLARAVNNALKLNSTAVNVPGKRKKGKSSDDLRPSAEFPLEMLDEAWELSQKQAKDGNDKEFEEKVAAYIKSQNSKINTKRNIKRNATTITVVSAIIIAGIFAAVNTIKTRGADYTSVGLTSTQTIRAWMNAVNEKDTMLLSDFGNGRAANDFGDMVSRIYVMHKQRLAYGNDNGFAYPANWLFYITDEAKYKKSGIYGVTNLKIDGKAESLSVELKRRNEKPAPLEKEGSVTLQKGSTSVHKIEYYLLYTEGDEVDYIVEKVTSTVTLTFKKNRWVITGLSSENENINADCEAFKADYFEALKENDGEVIKAVNSLRGKYEWLPEKDAMERERERIIYKLEHPFGELGL